MRAEELGRGNMHSGERVHRPVKVLFCSAKELCRVKAITVRVLYFRPILLLISLLELS